MPTMDAAADAASSAEEAPSEAELITFLIAKRELWPSQISLSENTRFPAMFRGAKVGEVEVPRGAKVDLVAIKRDLVEVRFRDGVRHLPHDATNLAELAKAAHATDVAAAGTAARPKASSTAPAPSAAGKSEVDAALLSAARRIDGAIRASLAKKRLRPPEPVSDEKFLRRAYVAAVGRIPTTQEAAQFLADNNPHKRGNLVARLVRSPGYASQMTNWMFDRLRIVDHNKVAQIRYPFYRQWVKDAVTSNMRWDRMVEALLTARGGGWDNETAPVGYFTRDRGMPLDNLAITMRVFLGSRMECAQCHNDPFGDTKQKDFFRLAAFTNGQDPMKQELFAPIYHEMVGLREDGVHRGAAIMFWRDIYGNSLDGGGTGRIALPHDYKYKDGRPGEIEGARVPFGKATSTTGRRDRDDGREKLAEWMTQGTGDRFPAMIANSMWRKIMGRGFFEPGDEYLELADTHEPEVSEKLVELMVELGYNLRDYQEVLMLTEAFQAGANPAESLAVGGADDFLGRRVQRLSAEEVWDSLVTLIDGNPDNQPARGTDDRIFINGQPVLEGVMTMTQLSREVLQLQSEEELRRYLADFVEKVKSSAEDPSPADGAMAMMQGDPVGFVRGAHARASELPSPAPPSHFLTLFGQSNRELVDGSTRDPNMGQVLSLMNGFVQRELVGKPEAQLNVELAGAEEPEEKIRRLYLSIFSREPTPEESAELEAEFAASPETASANIASAMIMSAEFLYLQ